MKELNKHTLTNHCTGIRSINHYPDAYSFGTPQMDPPGRNFKRMIRGLIFYRAGNHTHKGETYREVAGNVCEQPSLQAECELYEDLCAAG